MSGPKALGRQAGPLVLALFGGLAAALAVGLLVLAGLGALPTGVAAALAAVGVAGSAAAIGIVAVLKRRLAVMESELVRFRQQAMRELGTTRRVAEETRRLLARATFDPYRYWEERIETHGIEAVGDISRPLAELSDDTVDDKARILPFLKAQLRGDEARLLDFGCGYGRFTSDLAELMTEGAVGVDATPRLLDAARDKATSDKVEFVQARGTLPFPDNHFDVVWVAYVLIHLIGPAKADMARELDRVLKPGGLLFVTEGVTVWRQGSAHCDFVPFGWFERNFPYGVKAYDRADLAPLDAAELEARMARHEAANTDLHLVMVGRKPDA